MTKLDRLTFRKLAEDNLERLNTKAERKSFLLGLSLGARELNDDERERTANDLCSLYGIDKADLTDDQPNHNGKMKVNVGAHSADVANFFNN